MIALARRHAPVALLIFGLGFVCDVAGAQAVEGAVEETGARGGDDVSVDGRLSLRDVFVSDNRGFDVHLAFLDADLDLRNFASLGSAALNLKLDSRFIQDFTQDVDVSQSAFTGVVVKRNERRFGETQSAVDLRQFYLEAKGLGPLDVRAGRVFLYQAGGAWVDGLDLSFDVKADWSLGAFGGLQPDPFDSSPTTDRQTAGLYIEHQSDRLTHSASYTFQLLEGELDRHFFFSRGHWNVPVGGLTKSLFLSYFASIDLPNSAIELESPVATMLFTNASWWLGESLNFTAHYARYATSRIRDPKQLKFKAEDNQRGLLGARVLQGPYDQVRLSAVQRFSHFHVYQQVDFRRRELLDGEDAIYYRAGLRDSSVFGSRLYLHARVTVRDNFLSDSTEFLLESSYRFESSLQLDLAAAYLTGTSFVAFQDQDVVFANAGLSFDLAHDLYLALEYDLTLETNIQQEEVETAGDLLVHTIFSRLTYRL